MGLKGWKSYLLWEGLPFLMPLSIFAFISLVNWDYEKKLIIPDNNAPDWNTAHMGLILLGIALIQASVASLILFLVRFFVPKPNMGWYAALTLVSILFVFPAIFSVVLGPAAITMMEQMRSAPSER